MFFFDIKSIVTGLLSWQMFISFTLFTSCGGNTRRRLEPREFSTRYGSLVGLVTAREHLLPVEVFNGLQFASTRQKRLRFMPPSGTLEKWLGTRVFYNSSFRGVCPQRESFNKQTLPFPFEVFEGRLRYIEKYVMHRKEECLMLNLNIPRKGNVICYICYFLMFT